MNGRKEREHLVAGLESLLRSESKITEDYRGLAETLDGIPVGVLLDWVALEEEAHHTLLVGIIHSLKRTVQNDRGNRANDVEMERETMLCWVERLKAKEQEIVTLCRTLKSQTGRDTGGVVGVFLDAVIMDSEKHQGFLVAVEKAIDGIIMSRPQ